jgi:hypothetical protein
MTVVVERVATLLFGTRPEVYRGSELSRLVDEVLVDGGGVVQRVVYAQDITAPHPPGWVPETVLVVTVSGDCGALYYRGSDRRAWITHNPQPTPDSPRLLFDAEAPADFPAEAAIPVETIRAAVEEYLETGARPTRMPWREPDRYMTW